MTTRCVAVIGHVDHGKTTLVEALTGTRTDRLSEEKARGLSIVPGYAFCSYPAGSVDLVDAPGHADFVGAMVQGCAGAEAVLMVISLVDGISPQTQEHLEIATLLGITKGIVVLSMADKLPPEARTGAAESITSRLAGTILAKAPKVICSSRTGEGIGQVHQALATLLDQPVSRVGPDASFLSVDRAFSVAGHGTVVTGTLVGQDLLVETPLWLYPNRRQVGLRALQVRGEARQVARAGERVAANLRGVELSEVARGTVLRADATAPVSTCVDALISLSTSADRPLRHMQDIRVLLGTAAQVAQVRLIGTRTIKPGSRGYAQLRFAQPVSGFAGQRAVLRQLSPPAMLGGAVLIDPDADPLGRDKGARRQVLEAAQSGDVTAIARALSDAGRGVADLSKIARLARRPDDDVRSELRDVFVVWGEDAVSPMTTVAQAQADYLATLERLHAANPLHRQISRAALPKPMWSPLLWQYVEARLQAAGQIIVDDNRLASSTHDPLALMTKAQRERMAVLEQTFRQAGLSPPGLDALGQGPEVAALVDLLCADAALVAVRNVALKQTLYLHIEVLNRAAQTLRDRFDQATSFTTSEARKALATSRRVVVPVLEYFDSRQITRREGDLRWMTEPNSVSPRSRD